MKKYTITIIMVIAFAVILYVILHNFLSADKTTVNKSNSETQDAISKEPEANTDTIAYGLYNAEGKYVDNGSKLTAENNVVNVNVSIDHNLNERREYALIVLEDFKQESFNLENKKESTKKYLFTMNPNTSKNIGVKVPVNQNAQELTFLLTKKPSYKLKEMNPNKAAILGEVLSMRYPLDHNNNLANLKETKPDDIIKDGLNENMFITSDRQKLKSVITEKEGKTLSFSVGNDTEKTLRYAIIALKDWKQIDVTESKKVLYTTVAASERQLFDFKLPHANKDSNFQLIAFPYPYQVSKDNYESQQAFGSFRTVIQPSNHPE
ncbi:hypothetical protein SAMN04487777_107134 [Priestia aryabhattai B8W22]|uniref:hypothetical protein n=1 Tax=Priestia aryabhattai TaxID=412384 RepID=UPI00088F99F1|nr:hypothetical protein SAMN04487777_107134 [Priestia aryabhattai B8W22]